MFPTDETADRGQILVIVGLLIAVMLVALALVLNAAIFAENLSTRETADSEEPSSYAADTGSTVADVYNRTNDNDTRKAVYAKTSFNESLETWADSRSDTAAENGALFEADWTTHVGWRLEQDENRSFTPADNDSATGWTVAGDARDVAGFRLNVSRGDLYDGVGNSSKLEDNAFRVNVSDGTDDWKLYVFRDSGNSTVVVYEGNPPNDLGDLLSEPETKSCTAETDRATVDFQEPELNDGDDNDDDDCDALSFDDDLEGNVSVRYENVQDGSGTERVNGTYTLVINGSDAVDTDADGHPKRFNAPESDPPTATAVVYAVRYDTRYQRKEVVHDVQSWHSPREEAYQQS